MSGKRDIAWVADTVVAHQKSKLPAKLNTLDTEYNDGIILEDIPDDNYYVSEKANPPGYPLFCAIPERTDMNPFDGQSRYNIEYHFLTLAVALVSRGEPEEMLKRRTMRTIRGVSEVILDDRTMGASVDDVIILAKEYSPIVTDGENPFFLSEGSLDVRIQTHP